MRHYTHFTTEEREKSRVLKAQGLSIRAIARELGRAPSSVSREFQRMMINIDMLYQEQLQMLLGLAVS